MQPAWMTVITQSYRGGRTRGWKRRWKSRSGNCFVASAMMDPCWKFRPFKFPRFIFERFPCSYWYFVSRTKKFVSESEQGSWILSRFFLANNDAINLVIALYDTRWKKIIYINIYLERGKKCENWLESIHIHVSHRPCSFRTINTIDKFLIQTLIAHQFLNPIRCNLLQLYPSPPLSED